MYIKRKSPVLSTHKNQNQGLLPAIKDILCSHEAMHTAASFPAQHHTGAHVEIRNHVCNWSPPSSVLPLQHITYGLHIRVVRAESSLLNNQRLVQQRPPGRIISLQRPSSVNVPVKSSSWSRSLLPALRHAALAQNKGAGKLQVMAATCSDS